MSVPKEVVVAWKLENEWFAKVKRFEIPCDDMVMAFATIADFARDTLARLLKSEWAHCEDIFEAGYKNPVEYWEREKWTDADWRALAEKKLRGEK